MTGQNKRDNRIAEQAAEWMVALDQGSEEQRRQRRRDFDAWKQADPRHAEAARRVEAFVGNVSGFREAGGTDIESARKALEAGLRHKIQGRRKQWPATTLALLLLIGVPSTVVLQRYPLAHLMADIHAPAGQWREHTLADGSRIVLAGKGAVDVTFTESRRSVRLHGGEIYVDVAADSARPFVVTSDYGSIEALGTRFIVNHRNGDRTRLTMIESKVRVTSSAGDSGLSLVVQGSEQLRLDASGLGQVTAASAGMQESRWQNRQLVVQGWPLAEVLAELKRFHPGYLHFDAAAMENIRVSAVLPLDDPDRALQLLASSFSDIRLRRFTRWMVVVSRSGEAAR
jgi:transmembrane sensor